MVVGSLKLNANSYPFGYQQSILPYYAQVPINTDIGYSCNNPNRHEKTIIDDPKNLLIGAGAILGGGALTVLTGGAILPLLITGGTGFGLYEAGKTVSSFNNACTAEDNKKTLIHAGEALLAIGVSILGAKPALRKMGLLAKNTNALKALFECIGESPNSIGKSYRILKNSKALFSTEGREGIRLARHTDFSDKGKDKTVNGFFNIGKTGKNKYGTIKFNGEKVELPDLDDPIDCWKWWKKHIGKKPLSVKDRERAVIITRLPRDARNRILANLSKEGHQLTQYDTPELIRYRLRLNKRRVSIENTDATGTSRGNSVINKVTDIIYRRYICQGVKNEKKLFVMIGQKAAGKSTLVDMMRKKHGVLVADSDEIREIIGGQETILHGRLKFGVKDELANRAIDEGANFLAQFHGTGTGKASEIIAKFKRAGYNVEVINLEVPEKELVSRIFKRKAASNKDADPLSVILCGKKEQKENFYSIVKKSGAHKAKRCDNDVEFGDAPRELQDKYLHRFVLRVAR